MKRCDRKANQALSISPMAIRGASALWAIAAHVLSRESYFPPYDTTGWGIWGVIEGR